MLESGYRLDLGPCLGSWILGPKILDPLLESDRKKDIIDTLESYYRLGLPSTKSPFRVRILGQGEEG